MSQKKIRTAIIGTGGIGSCHTNGYNAAAEKGKCEIVACCDIDIKKARAFAESNGIPAVYSNYNKMLEEIKPDAVSVTTWNSAHMAPTISALEHGIDVICEKPMAINARQAQKMRDTAEKNGRILQIGFVRRFGEDAELAKKIIDSGELGDIYYAKAFYMRRRGCPGKWFADKKYSGGGPLIDLGVHVIDLTRYLTGFPKATEVFGSTNSGIIRETKPAGWQPDSSFGGRKFDCNVEDITSAMIRFDNGMTLMFEACFNLNMKESDRNSVELFGKKNGIVIDPTVLSEPLSDGSRIIIPEEAPKFDFYASFNREIESFVDCVASHSKPRADGNDGLEVMRIIDAVYKSAKTGKSVSLA